MTARQTARPYRMSPEARAGLLLATAPPYADATTLDQLREHGPFADIFTRLLGPTTAPVSAWLRPATAEPAV
jgi:hypothetical protein